LALPRLSTLCYIQVEIQSIMIYYKIIGTLIEVSRYI